MDTAHTPKVAGSNPGPAIREPPLNQGVRGFSRFILFVRMTGEPRTVCKEEAILRESVSSWDGIVALRAD